MRTEHRIQSQAKRRWVADPRAFQRVMNRLEPFTADELLRLELPIRMSFQALRNGKGTAQDFHDIAAAINVTIVRSESINALCEQTAIAARDALMRCWDRHEKTGRWGFDGPALTSVEEGIALHEQLVELSTPQQMVEAMHEVMRRTRNGETV